ncbi:mannitol dehydrogenase family protein [Cryobacterium melibiosiphilum]|uniref:Mannitol-1-phosphate 5-dehydrogenase n=1 Tax=Cryobacterium melibiosiphilum TaxID=995039 RepID=A0A3A5MFM8_9MICO|nr:mannitol dehydrogenase family protein [Cryobacterium melibiosiphilum]RJT86217.1 mannitol dehydrogenase family protein [Cryobacterium melibiosiphilum]
MSASLDTLQAGRLSRAAYSARSGRARATPPVRIVHLGLGAFHRAHQAWFTAQVDEAGEWGIAAFTGRNAQAALELQPQDGLFTLIERSEAADAATIVTSIVEAVDGANLARLLELLAAPTTSIVTLTITEAGYRFGIDGLPNADDPAVAADVVWLRAAFSAATLPHDLAHGPTTTMGRLLLGLEARRRAGAEPIAVVPCDNIPDNGEFLARGLGALARSVSPATAEWIAASVSFVTTSVDRITPRTTPADLNAAAALTGWCDDAAVVTEPFRDWVLSGRFPGGRPAWERAGARFVDDIAPFERRKLWMLNGAHSLLAYDGLLRGHDTVAEAMADPVCRARVNNWWDAVVRWLPPQGLELEAYRGALLERFDNARIEHRLGQISGEAVTKLRVRIVPTVLAERAAGRTAPSGLRAIGSWVALVLRGYPFVDAESAAIAVVVASGGDGAVAALVALVDPRLATDAALLADIRAVVAASAA